MAILTRETNGTGVTNNGAPLTNAELDNNFIEIVADIADKVATTDLNESVDDRVNSLLQAGNGIDLSYDDPNGELTISSEVTEITAYNGTGSTLSKGTVVYQSGVQGTNISVAAASNGSASTMPAVGIVISDIADTATGQIAVAGLVKNLDTSSFSAGDVLYVGTSGALTATKPTGESNLIQNFGRALKINASSGEVLVLGAGRSNDTPNLNDGNVFIGNASNQVETRALVEADISDLQTYLTAESDTLDSVTGRGATTSNNIQVGDATVTGNLTVQGTTTTLNTATLEVEDKNITINYSTGDSSGSADGAGITIQDAVNSTTDATILWDATGDKFEFSHAVDVAGNITLTGTVDGRDIATDGTKLDGIEASADVTDATNVAAAGAVMDGDFTANGFMKRTGAGTYTVDTSTYLTSYTETDTLDSVTGRGATTTNSISVGGLIVDTNTLYVDSTNNRVGIGTSVPSKPLELALLSAQRWQTGSTTLDLTPTSGATDSFVFNTSQNAIYSFSIAGTQKMRLESGGLVMSGANITSSQNGFNPTTGAWATGAAFIGTSSYGGGLSLVDGTGGWGFFVDTAGANLRLAQGSTSGGLDTKMSLDNSGRVGIGDSTPDAGLTVHNNAGAVIATSNIARQTYTSIGNLQVSTAGSGGILIHTESTTAEGALTFGDGNYAGRILYNHSSNYMGFHSNAAERMRLEADGDLHADGDVIAYSTTISDERLKDDVETIDSALDKVNNLRGVTYTWNAGSREGKRDLGVIAQEVEAVIPEIVHEKNMALIDGETYKTVDYEKLTAVLIEAVKELKAEVNALKAAQ